MKKRTPSTLMRTTCTAVADKEVLHSVHPTYSYVPAHNASAVHGNLQRSPHQIQATQTSGMDCSMQVFRHGVRRPPPPPPSPRGSGGGVFMGYMREPGLGRTREGRGKGKKRHLCRRR